MGKYKVVGVPYTSPLPKDLLDSLREGTENPLLVFAGAGVSAIPLTSMPNWKDLLDKLLLQCKAKIKNNSGDFDKATRAVEVGEFIVAQTLIAKMLDDSLGQSLYKELEGESRTPYNKAHEAIFGLKPKGILTTNYDRCFHRVIAESRGWEQREADNTKGLREALQSKDSHIFWALHGTVGSGEADSSPTLAFGRDGYESLYKTNSFRKILNQLFTDHVVLFLGFSFSDPDLVWLLEDVRREKILTSNRTLKSYILLVKRPRQTLDHFLRTVERLESEGLHVLLDLDETNGIMNILERLARAKQLVARSISSAIFESAEDIRYEAIDIAYDGYSKSAEWLYKAWLSAEKKLDFPQTYPVLEVGAGSGISTRVFLKSDTNLGRHRDFLVTDADTRWRDMRQYRLGLAKGKTLTNVGGRLCKCKNDEYETDTPGGRMRLAAEKLLEEGKSPPTGYKYRIRDEEFGIDVRLARTFLGDYLGRIGVVLFASSMHWTASVGKRVEEWNLSRLLHTDALGHLLAPKCLLVWNASAVQFDFGERLVPTQLIEEIDKKYNIKVREQVKLNEIKFTDPNFFQSCHSLPDSPHNIFLKSLQEEINDNHLVLGRKVDLKELWGKEDKFRNMYTIDLVHRVVKEVGFELLDCGGDKEGYRLDWIPMTRKHVVDTGYGVGGFMRYFTQNELPNIKANERLHLLGNAVKKTNAELEKYSIKPDDLLGLELFATFVAYRK